jgi:hypothetical protein
MLVVILWRELAVFFRNNLSPAALAPVNTGVRRNLTGLIDAVVCVPFPSELVKEFLVFVPSHNVLLSRALSFQGSVKRTGLTSGMVSP